MEFRQKQIWIINFDPSFGHEYQKVRPGVIIENDLFIPQFELMTIVPISSNINNSFILDVELPKTDSSRLMKDSILKTKQINTFDKRRFIKFIGYCETHIFEKLMDNIYTYLKYSS